MMHIDECKYLWVQASFEEYLLLSEQRECETEEKS